MGMGARNGGPKFVFPPHPVLRGDVLTGSPALTVIPAGAPSLCCPGGVFLFILKYSCSCSFLAASDERHASPVRVLICSHSIVSWARKRALRCNLGSQLGPGEQACINWVGKRGMCWGQLLPALLECVKTHPPPQLVVVHLGENDLGKWTTISLRLHTRRDLARLVQWLPGIRTIWSSLLP